MSDSLIKKNAINFAAIVVIIIIASNIAIILYNKGIIDDASKSQLKNEKLKHLFTNLWADGIHNLDLGLRGYYINKDKSMLSPFERAKKCYFKQMAEIETIVSELGEDNKKALGEIKVKYDEYLLYSDYLLSLIEKDSLDMFREELKKDKGYELWMIFEKNSLQITTYLNAQNEEAKAKYEEANQRIFILQVILAFIGFPTLIFMIIKIRKDKVKRQQLFVKLEKNHREYVFDPGTPIEVGDEQQMVNDTISKLKNTSAFINEISKGNLDSTIKELTPENISLNKNNITGELIQMKERMKAMKAEDDKRKWVADGLVSLSEIIRNNQSHLEELCFQVLTFVVKYLKVQQGGVFVVREDEEAKTYLELKACYAFSRKKFLEKRIEVGEGLVGQTYLEKTSTMLTEIPDNYVSITSGLGDNNASCILIVPMMYNDNVEAIIEIAGFKKFEPYQIEFLEKLGDILASTIGTVKTNEKTRELLEQFKLQTEQLKAQEEELKQNMEEMHATQEAIRRAEKEIAV